MLHLPDGWKVKWVHCKFSTQPFPHDVTEAVLMLPISIPLKSQSSVNSKRTSFPFSVVELLLVEDEFGLIVEELVVVVRLATLPHS